MFTGTASTDVVSTSVSDPVDCRWSFPLSELPNVDVDGMLLLDGVREYDFSARAAFQPPFADAANGWTIWDDVRVYTLCLRVELTGEHVLPDA